MKIRFLAPHRVASELLEHTPTVWIYIFLSISGGGGGGGGGGGRVNVTTAKDFSTL